MRGQRRVNFDNSIDNADSAVATVQNIWSCILTQPSPGAQQCCIVKTSVDLAANNALGHDRGTTDGNMGTCGIQPGFPVICRNAVSLGGRDTGIVQRSGE